MPSRAAWMLIFAGVLHGESPPGPLVQELFTTDGVYGQGRQELQATLKRSRAGAPRLSFEYGLTDTLQVNLSSEGTAARATEVGFMRTFRNPFGRSLDFAVGFETEFDGEGREHSPYLIVGRALGAGAHVHANVRTSLTNAGEGPEWGGGIILAKGPRLRFSQELTVGAGMLEWTPGVFWIARGIGEIGAGVAVPFRGSKRAPGVMVTFTREFELAR